MCSSTGIVVVQHHVHVHLQPELFRQQGRADRASATSCCRGIVRSSCRPARETRRARHRVRVESAWRAGEVCLGGAGSGAGGLMKRRRTRPRHGHVRLNDRSSRAELRDDRPTDSAPGGPVKREKKLELVDQRHQNTLYFILYTYIYVTLLCNALCNAP